jgi:copper chaperone CopZ
VIAAVQTRNILAFNPSPFRVLKFRVGMTCGGCKTAVSNLVSKVPGVQKATDDVRFVFVSLHERLVQFEANVEKKTLEVHGTATREAIAGALSKWAVAGKKEVTFVEEVSA